MHNSDIKLGYKFSFGAKKSSGISALENDDHWGYLVDEAKQHIGWHSTRGTGKVPSWKVFLHDLSRPATRGRKAVKPRAKGRAQDSADQTMQGSAAGAGQTSLDQPAIIPVAQLMDKYRCNSPHPTSYCFIYTEGENAGGHVPFSNAGLSKWGDAIVSVSDIEQSVSVTPSTENRKCNTVPPTRFCTQGDAPQACHNPPRLNHPLAFHHCHHCSPTIPTCCTHCRNSTNLISRLV